MKWLKRLAITLVSLSVLLVGGFYLYIQTLPSAPPQYVSAEQVNAGASKLLSCAKGDVFNAAYDVAVEIESKIGEQTIYLAGLNFKTQLQQANDDVIKAIATDIRIQEGTSRRSHGDIFYLSKITGERFALFSAYNDLGLVEKHPMKAYSQFLKALSVGEKGKSYFFSYDPSQKTYRYINENNQLVRTSHITTANSSQLAGSLAADVKNNWRVVMGDGCVPVEIYSDERQGFLAGKQNGFIKFIIRAQKIDNYLDLNDQQLTASTNASYSWDAKAIDAQTFGKKVTSEKEMWEIVKGFSDDRNVARLRKAADYMVGNVPAEDLASLMAAGELTDQQKRDLAFGLSMSNAEGVEEFILETLDKMPAGAGNDVDMQKVRLMVSLSSNGSTTDQSFNSLNGVRQNPNESQNVKNNSLITMGSLVSKAEQNQSGSSIDEEFGKIIKEELAGDSSSSAILAAGNAKTDEFDTEIMDKLNTGSDRERYAAASVLSRNPDYNNQMINHLQNEQSLLVVNAIMSNIKTEDLSGNQIDQLQQIANSTSNSDIAKLINNKVN